MIQFLYPQAFWGFGLLLILIGVLGIGYYRRRSLLRTFGQENLIRQTSRLSQNWDQWIQGGLLMGAVIALIITLARPVWPGGSIKLREGSLDVVAVLDVSRSMAAEDYGDEVSRLQKAKDMLMGLFPDLVGNRVGLVTFAREGFVQSNLTDDLVALKFVLQNWVKIESAPGGGSNILLALSEAYNLFKEEDRSKLILLFSDGGDVALPDLLPIQEKLSSKKIKVIAIGLGNLKGSKIPVYGKDGKFEDWYRINNELILTRLNESPLRELAAKTDGKYLRVISGKELQGLLKHVELVGEKSVVHEKEFFQIPLGLALLLLFIRKSSFLTA
ncbi:MAG TPA: VWA domain-containing protein [Candidatus Limnocylindrales bacterium]|nr:VWA domain-containing protein [Candidatus Limnocylindrales bacterium]